MFHMQRILMEIGIATMIALVRSVAMLVNQ